MRPDQPARSGGAPQGARIGGHQCLQVFSTLPLIMAADGYRPGTYGALLALNGTGIVVVQPIAVRLLDGRDIASVLAVSAMLLGIGGALAGGPVVPDRRGQGE
jgi:hypothetical protein